MLTELCMELKNWFEIARVFGQFAITDGTIDLGDAVQDGQYIRIVGSVFNDGVYQYPPTGLTDESFDGAVWLMAVPPQVITLASEIGEWVGKYGSVVTNPYTSESFGGYSYSKAGATGDAAGATWQSTFAERLNKWRKI